jgi:hypothetical protein
MSTILSQLPLPTSIEKYSPEDQEILNEFLIILQHFEVNTSKKRETLLGLLDTYIDKYYPDHEDYFRLSFLWFAVDYFNVARRVLSVAGFYPDDFYRYLVQYFRGNSQIQGIFNLIQTTTPLTDLRWEKLQYSCNKFTVALTDDEIQVLEAVFSYVSTAGIQALNQQRIKTTIANIVKKRSFTRRLARFFTLLNAQWTIRFYPPSFGLERLYFHFQLNKSASLFKILDFQNPTNITLGVSNVYRIDEFHNYLGIMWLPTQAFKPMQSYLLQKEKEGLLILNGLTRINDTQVSCSLTLYEQGKGWRNLSTSEYRRLNHQLRPSTVRRKSSESPPFFLAPPFHTRWHFQKDTNEWTANQFISIFCKISNPFRFDNLPLSGHSKKYNLQFSKAELKLLTKLHNNQAIQVHFNPIRLFEDFSLDQYWIQVPVSIPFEKLKFLLSYLPNATILSAEDYVFISTILTPEFSQFLVHDIGWNVYKIIPLHWGKTFDIRWFDPQSNEWKIPYILKTFVH